jgi:hypothetical protein
VLLFVLTIHMLMYLISSVSLIVLRSTRTILLNLVLLLVLLIKLPAIIPIFARITVIMDNLNSMVFACLDVLMAPSLIILPDPV